jgi:DNA polymerase-3 subunit epsilon
MRQVIIDTETTGLDPKQGHRVIELAALELVDRRPTGRSVHLYLNPEREIDAGATDVHGMTWEMLREKPRFRDVAHEFVEFARGAQWIIHNAPFDIAFLDEELKPLDMACRDGLCAELVDTLALAREQFPGKRNSLDALCERFGIACTHRTLHGALLDAELLAEVYLAMTRGQDSLTIDITAPSLSGIASAMEGLLATVRLLEATAEELAAHDVYLSELDRESKGGCIWLELARGPEPLANAA